MRKMKAFSSLGATVAFAVIFLFVVPSFCFASSAAYSSWSLLATSKPVLVLKSPNPQAYGYFGTVALSGDLAVVGAFGENSSGIQGAGRAYVFNATTGKLISTLLSPNPYEGGAFGVSVAVSGDLVLVGAPYVDSSAGFAYVFNGTTGKLISYLFSPNPQAFGYFGWSVALSGKLAIVGAYGEIQGSSDDFAGHVYVFNAKTGLLLKTLVSPSFQFGGEFGYSVAGGNDSLLLVGAPYEASSSGLNEAGNAYLFNASTGKLLNKFSSPHPKEYGAFGYSASIAGVTLVVSASGIGGEDRIYTFNASTGALIGTLGPQGDHGFGWSVGAGGTGNNITVVVGAPFETVRNISGAGRAYTFAGSEVTGIFASPKPVEFLNYGLSVSASGNLILIGADNTPVNGIAGAGEAYVY